MAVDELPEELRPERGGLAVVAVVDLDEVEARCVGSDSPNDGSQLTGSEAERLHRARPWSEPRIGGVDVDATVDLGGVVEVGTPASDVFRWDGRDVVRVGALVLDFATGARTEDHGPIGDIEDVARDGGVAAFVARIGLPEVEMGVTADEHVGVGRAHARGAHGVFATDEQRDGLVVGVREDAGEEVEILRDRLERIEIARVVDAEFGETAIGSAVLVVEGFREPTHSPGTEACARLKGGRAVERRAEEDVVGGGAFGARVGEHPSQTIFRCSSISRYSISSSGARSASPLVMVNVS